MSFPIKEKKNFQRTIRMTERVRFILEAYEGKGMNEQFENLVLDYNDKIPEIMDQVEKLKREKEKILKEIAEFRELKYDLEEIEYAVNRAREASMSILSKKKTKS